MPASLCVICSPSPPYAQPDTQQHPGQHAQHTGGATDREHADHADGTGQQPVRRSRSLCQHRRCAPFSLLASTHQSLPLTLASTWNGRKWPPHRTCLHADSEDKPNEPAPASLHAGDVRDFIRQLLMADLDRQRGPGRGPFYDADDLHGDLDDAPSPDNSVRLINKESKLDGCIQTDETLPEKSQQLGAKLLVSDAGDAAVPCCWNAVAQRAACSAWRTQWLTIGLPLRSQCPARDFTYSCKISTAISEWTLPLYAGKHAAPAFRDHMLLRAWARMCWIEHLLSCRPQVLRRDENH